MEPADQRNMLLALVLCFGLFALYNVFVLEPQQKARNTQYYKWRDALLVTANNLVIPLEAEKRKAINEKWLAFNKDFK